MRMRHIYGCGLPGCTIILAIMSYVVRLWGKKLLNTKFVFWYSLQLSFEIFLIVRRNQRDTAINIHRSACKVSVILVRFLIKLEFSRNIFEKKNLHIQFKKITPVEAVKLIVSFSQFCERTYKWCVCSSTTRDSLPASSVLFCYIIFQTPLWPYLHVSRSKISHII
jgi:flagellar biosynthesis protein FlhB